MSVRRLDLVLRGGTIVTAEGRRQADLGIRAGLVAEIGEVPRGAGGVREIDARGLLLLPGGVDPHVHLNVEKIDPVEPDWVDDYFSGSQAALAGGITSVGNMSYVCPWETIAERVQAETTLVARQAIADVFFHTALLTPSQEIVAEVKPMIAAGQSSMKIFMSFPSFDAFVPQFTAVMRATAEAGGITLIHCEDLPTIQCCTSMLAHERKTAVAHYAESRPVESEIVATERAIAMCRATRAPTYIVHLSSARALRACAEARADGLPLYVETRPLYLYLTAECYAGDDAPLYVAQPPLRGADDVAALWRGLADGTIDTVASDHAPWTRELKMDPRLDIGRTRPGVAELDTMLPLLYTEGVVRGRISLERFVALTSTNAARLFGLYPRKGTIAVGSDADIVLWETRERRVLRDADLFSRAGHSVYEGREIAGWPRTTIRRGEIVFDDRRVVGEAGSGRVIARGLAGRLG